MAVIGRVANTRDDTGSSRVYKWGDEEFPSVTSILSKSIPKPALLPWGVKLVAEAAIAGIINGTLDAILDDQGVDAAIRHLKEIPNEQRDTAADLGSLIHGMLETVDESDADGDIPDGTAEDVVPFLLGFQAFLRDHRPQYIAQECTIFSRTHCYAGTLDAIMLVDGKKVLVDYKTGKNIYPEVALQLTAYRNADFIGQDGGIEIPMPSVDEVAVLHLRPGKYDFKYVDGSDDVFDCFKRVVALRKWQEMEKTVLKYRPQGARFHI